MYMPTLLTVNDIMIMIHTRDHGFPHVTVYKGTPDDHSAMMKVRIDLVDLSVLDGFGFNMSSANKIMDLIEGKREEFLEVWYATRPK
jgi:hypothetical protein